MGVQALCAKEIENKVSMGYIFKNAVKHLDVKEMKIGREGLRAESLPSDGQTTI